VGLSTKWRPKHGQREERTAWSQGEERFAESTLRLFIEAFRAGRELPNRDTVHKHFYEAAKVTRKMSEKGAKAWASLQVEELRRTAVAVIDAESNGSVVA
jgi:hypothetical protein